MEFYKTEQVCICHGLTLDFKDTQSNKTNILCYFFYFGCVLFQLEDGTWIEDEEQTLKIKTNFVISAFGSTLSDSDGKSADKQEGLSIIVLTQEDLLKGLYNSLV